MFKSLLLLTFIIAGTSHAAEVAEQTLKSKFNFDALALTVANQNDAIIFSLSASIMDDNFNRQMPALQQATNMHFLDFIEFSLPKSGCEVHPEDGTIIDCRNMNPSHAPPVPVKLSGRDIQGNPITRNVQATFMGVSISDRTKTTPYETTTSKMAEVHLALQELNGLPLPGLNLTKTDLK